MAVNSTRRGRPKGSGIDDRATVLEVAQMIAADPALKPTTAIKTLGIEDPSIIRRLRDKYSDYAKTNIECDEFVPAHRTDPSNDNEQARTICLERMRDPQPKRSAHIPEERPRPPHGHQDDGGSVPRQDASAKSLLASTRTGTNKITRPDVETRRSPLIASPVFGERLAADATPTMSSFVSASVQAAATTVHAQIFLGTQMLHSPPALAAMRFQLAWTAFFVELCRPQPARPNT
ncbi:MAG: hypothetical protein NW217_16340 [Hyphomicrobiaceae bacterium]|nr:hypothetical protein [Hyphomicrobiaceae bacterium]